MTRNRSAAWLAMSPQGRLAAMMAHASTEAPWGEFAEFYGLSEQSIRRAAGELGISGWDAAEALRTNILRALADQLPRTPGGITTLTGGTKQRVGHAIQALRKSGSVRSTARRCKAGEEHGPWVMYEITPAGLAELARTAPRKVA